MSRTISDAAAAEIAAAIPIPVERGQLLRPYLSVGLEGYRIHFAHDGGIGRLEHVGPTFPPGRTGLRSALALAAAIDRRITG